MGNARFILRDVMAKNGSFAESEKSIVIESKEALSRIILIHITDCYELAVLMQNIGSKSRFGVFTRQILEKISISACVISTYTIFVDLKWEIRVYIFLMPIILGRQIRENDFCKDKL